MTNRLRIGFEAKRAFHNSRGLGNYCRTLIEGLDTYCPQHEKFLYSPFDRKNEYQDFLSTLKHAKVCWPEGFMGKISSSVWRSFLLSNQAQKDQLDIFHGLSHELPYAIEKCSFKKVVTIHDLIFLRYPEFFPWIDRKIYFKKFEYSTRASDKVLAICEQTKRDIIHFLGTPEEKIEVAYQSCHPRFYHSWTSSEKDALRESLDLPDNYILYVGAFEKRKNILSLIHAFALLKDEFSHSLVLVGQGRSYKKRMLDLIDHYDLHDRIRLISPTNEELPGVYQQASLFAFPSFFEGFGIPIVEALFSGTPVVTSEGSCFPESGGPDSLYIDPNRVDDLAEAMRSVLIDKDKAQSMSMSGVEYAERFHLKNTTENLENFYFSVMRDKFVSS
jgi:glycosyltransferase involved in cell wall biosynthesis